MHMLQKFKFNVELAERMDSAKTIHACLYKNSAARMHFSTCAILALARDLPQIPSYKKLGRGVFFNTARRYFLNLGLTPYCLILLLLNTYCTALPNSLGGNAPTRSKR